MLFSKDKDEDDDFVPNPNYHSNLASIFGSNGSDGNPSLTYTAPKQPKRQSKNMNMISQPSTSTTPSGSSSVIIFKSVQSFKMVDGSYHNEGRVGMAIISYGSEESRTYQLLLYLNRNNHLCSARITKEFNFHVQPKNYCTFYDKNSVIWSVLFDNPSDMVEFNMQMAITKWKDAAKLPLISQDLWYPLAEDPKSSASGLGDTVELTCSLYSFLDISKTLEDDLTVSATVESGGWKAALVGMLANCKRVIIMRPEMLDENMYPKKSSYRSPVLLKVEALRVVKNRLDEPVGHKSEDIVSTQKEAQSKPTEAEKPENPGGSLKPTKADLITRMARMGQALPFKTTAPTPSDSDETEDDQSAHVHPTNTERAVPKARARVLPAVVGTTSLTSTVPMSTAISQQHPPIPWAQVPYMMSNMFAPPTSPGVDSQMHVFLSEMRTTNSELRMGITRLTDKVEALQTKIENKDRSSHINPDLSSLMEKMLENEKQTQQILSAVNNAQLMRPTPPPNADVLETSPPCQKCARQEQCDSLSDARVKEFQDQIEYLQMTNSAQKDAIQNAKITDQNQMARIEVLGKQLEEEQRRVSELNERLQAVQAERDAVAGDLAATAASVSELQHTLQEKQTTIDRLELSLQQSEETKLEEVRRNLQEVLDPKPFIGDHLKKILNVVYRLVKLQFEPQKHYDAIFIQSVLAETIKGVTLEYLENGNLLLTEGGQERAQTRHNNPLQSQSAPTVSSVQNKSGETNGQKMQQEKSSSVKVEAKLAAGDGVETEMSVPQQDSADSIYADSVSTQEANNEEAAPDVEQNAEVSATTSNFNSTDSSSDDAWRPQPPPLPLFDEEDNDDDWLNS